MIIFELKLQYSIMNKEVSSFIESANPKHQEILKELRKLILSVAPQSEEQYKWSRPVYGLEKDFCYLQSTKKHVAFGFFEFDKIKTNTHLIEGTGKSMRHIKLTDKKQIKEMELKKIIKELLQ